MTVASTLRILIVDDNQDGAELLATLIGSFGHVVRVANNGFSALEQARSFLPHILFLDIAMPAMSGLTVARTLREDAALRQVCIAAVTGWDHQQVKQDIKAAGFNFHIPKPAGLAEVLRVIELYSLAEVGWVDADLC